MKIYVTYHPSAVLRGGYHLEERILEDFKRVGLTRLVAPRNNLPRGSASFIAFDTEYDPSGRLLTLGIANETSATAFEATDKGWKAKAKQALSRAKRIRGHNVTGDLDYLLREKLPVRADWLTGEGVDDSLLLARMHDENRGGRGSYNLETLMLSEFNVEPWKAVTDAQFKKTKDASLWTLEERVERCRLDAWASYVLADYYLSRLNNSPVVRFSHKVALTLHRVGLAGAAIDLKVFHKLGKEWKLEAQRKKDLLIKAALRLGMKEFSPTNDDHIRELLYKRLKLPVTATTAKSNRPAVDKITLRQFARLLPPEEWKKSDTPQWASSSVPEVKLLLQFNTSDKMASTWYGGDNDGKSNRKKSLKELIAPLAGNKHLGLLHNWINPLGARTGRRSSGGGDEGTPESRNSQNWPKRARVIVVSRWPKGKIGAHDYKSLEPVLYGWISQDEQLFEYFYNGGGYLDIANKILNKPVEKDTEPYRLVKSLTLGIFYNMGEWKMANELWFKNEIRLATDFEKHQEKVSRLRKNFYWLFRGLRKYQLRQMREVKETQQVVAPDGYIRHLPHHGEPQWGASKIEKKHWGHVLNVAVNFPVQHMASMVTGSALVDVETAILKEHKITLKEWHEMLLKNPSDLPCSVVINEVHDEVTVDYNPRTYKRDREIVEEMMGTVPSLRKLVPSLKFRFKVEPKIGPAWGVAA